MRICRSDLSFMMKFPAPPKPRTQPTQEGSNNESSYGDQHLWFRPEPTLSTAKEQFSHGDGNPDPHVGKVGRQHDEECSHYPADHETSIFRNAGQLLSSNVSLEGPGGLAGQGAGPGARRPPSREAACPSLGVRPTRRTV